MFLLGFFASHAAVDRGRGSFFIMDVLIMYKLSVTIDLVAFKRDDC